MNKMFVSKVIVDEDGNLVMLFPEDLYKALELRENEVLAWEVDPKTREVRIRRPNFIDNSKAAN